MIFNRRARKAEALRKAAEDKEERMYQEGLDLWRNEQMGQCTSIKELTDRVVGGTCSEHYGYVPNLFGEMPDEDLAKCLRSYFAVRRGIGPGQPLLIEKIEQYIDTWKYALENDDTVTDNQKTADATRACYIDLCIEAATRFCVLQDRKKQNE